MSELANMLARRFIARPDVKAVQHADGAWHPERTPFKRPDLIDHIEGRRTLGHYVLSKDSMCKFLCYDLDLTKTGVWCDDLGTWHEDFSPREAWLNEADPSRDWQTIQLRCLAEGLAAAVMRVLNLGTAISYSGSKGLHVYGFLDEPAPAADVRSAAHVVLNDFGCFERTRGDNFWKHTSSDPHTGYPNIEIEVFPKQDSLEGKDLGNLLRLPLGINRKSGHKSFFLDVGCGYNQLKAADPMEVLTTMNPWPKG